MKVIRLELRNSKRQVIGYVAVLDDDFTRDVLMKRRWHLLKNGYASTTERDGRQKYLHHIVFENYHGKLNNLGTRRGCEQIDHVDRDKLNCVPSNLRLVSISIQRANRSDRKASSGYKNVCWHPQTGKWRASISKNCKRISLGLYRTKEEAARAVNIAYRQYFPGVLLPNPGVV